MATDAAKVSPSPGCTRSSHALTDCAIPGTPQAFFLKANEDGVSLHTHLSEVLQSLLKSKDPNALANFESISLDVKAGRFQPSIGVKVRHHRWELLAGLCSRHNEAPSRRRRAYQPRAPSRGSPRHRRRRTTRGRSPRTRSSPPTLTTRTRACRMSSRSWASSSRRAWGWPARKRTGSSSPWRGSRRPTASPASASSARWAAEPPEARGPSR